MGVTVNPMVEYLNSLRTQQQDSNSSYIHEARRDFLLALQRQAVWFPDENQLHVRTHLDALVDDLVKGAVRIRLLFLTGDAGDGKTAFCAALARHLGFDGELQWETVIGSWRVIKDASEVPEEVLRTLIEEQLQDSRSDGLIVAINEGRLRWLFRGLSLEGRRLWKDIVERALEGWLDAKGAKALDEGMQRERVVVVNFRHRYHVRTVTPALLATWLPQALWELSPACGTCPARARCPILANVQDLRSPAVQERVADVLAYSHFSGQRLPFRRLQAVLALATTGGLRCSDVQSPKLVDASFSLLDYRYYNALFLRDELRTPVVVCPEPIARSFAGADPGFFVSPDLDRRIGDLLGPGQEEPRWNERHPMPRLEADAIRSIRERLRPGAQSGEVQKLQDDLSRLTRLFRRWAMFVDSVAPDLHWRRALELVEGYAEGRNDGDELRRTVVEAINRLHGVEGLKREVITGNQIDAAGFRTPARQVLELNLHTEFSTGLCCGPTLPDAVKPYLESAPSEIFLTAWPQDANVDPALLRLDARIVEIFLSIAEGFGGWQGLGAYRRALGRFHAHLLALASRAGRKPVVTIRAQGERYSVSVDLTGDQPRLRIEAQG